MFSLVNVSIPRVADPGANHDDGGLWLWVSTTLHWLNPTLASAVHPESGASKF
jgi:hypothetical protein